MKYRCLYCYEKVKSKQDFHERCSKAFFGTSKPPKLAYSLDQMDELAKKVVELSVSVTGVQSKLSMSLVKATRENSDVRLTVVGALGGNYIFKPPSESFAEMPENEHLSMKLAESLGIHVVPHNLIRLLSGELCYLTKRIDRDPNGTKIHMIDFLQIMELEDKYKGTMERLGKLIGDLSENTLLDKLRFFELAVFNYIIGNNDMHLKNFSMFNSDIGWVLSPAYDLLNVKIILPKDKEDSAILLGGKKENFSKIYFDRFGENLKLNKKQISGVYKRLKKWLNEAQEIIEKSFLSSSNKVEYLKLVNKRANIFISKITI